MTKIAIDTNPIYTTRAGISRYVRGLLKGLRKVATGFDITPIAWEVENYEYVQPQRAFRTLYRELYWARHIAPKILTLQNIALLHSTAGPLITAPKGIKEVVTLHDLAIFHNPQRFRLWHRWSFKNRIARIHSATKIICISRFTAEDAHKLLGLSYDKMIVIYNGFDRLESQRKPDFEIPSEYFLFVGSLEPGKNLQLLKEVYSLAKSSGINLPPLLITGARWQGVKNEGAPPADWFYLGFQPDEVLGYLYAKAIALIFPSKFEGFGLPILEAMSLGCPVVCSPVASIPEIAADAALYADLNVNEYLTAMKKIATDNRLRSELIEKSIARARLFSWEQCATHVLEVYKSVL
jgi:alpha-1,3-rhamnosyl/mannosyltransferase